MYVSDMQAYTVAAQSTRESKRENKRTFASFWVYYVMCGDGESVSQQETAAGQTPSTSTSHCKSRVESVRTRIHVASSFIRVFGVW